MNPDWLAQLAPAHAPPAAPWWPPAPGWWGLGFILITALVGFAYWWTRPQQRLRRVSLKRLAELERGGFDDVALAVQLQDLLRRHAVARYGREAVAKLSGPAWLAFLGEHGAAALSEEAGAALLRTVYTGEAGHVAPASLPARRQPSAPPSAPAQALDAGEDAGATGHAAATWLAAARGFIRYRPRRAWRFRK